MSHQPERALTQTLFVRMFEDRFVEMSHQPERALTLHYIDALTTLVQLVEMSHQPERALTHLIVARNVH